MSANNAIQKYSRSFERLFKILSKVFLIMTIALAILGTYAMWYLFRDPYNEGFERTLALLYFLSPAIITLILSAASYVAAKLAFNIRLELPADNKK